MAINRTADRETVVGVFHSRAEAQRAVQELKRAGFTDEQIGVVTRGHEEHEAAHDSDDSYAEEGAAIGGAAGLGAGALWGLGIVAGVLPAIGPVIAGGVLAAIAASAAGTAVAGGLAGALIGLGIPEDEADYYSGELESGRTIVTVKAGTKHAKAHEILDSVNAYDYHRRETDYASNPRATKRMNAAGEMVARKEVADIEKHLESTGEARVRKEVHAETKHVEVPVRREELVIERTPLNDREVGSIEGGMEEERVVLREEKVDVKKRTVGKEAVKVGKRVVDDSRGVDVELKEEEIVVDQDRDSHRGRPR